MWTTGRGLVCVPWRAVGKRLDLLRGVAARGQLRGGDVPLSMPGREARAAGNDSRNGGIP